MATRPFVESLRLSPGSHRMFCETTFDCDTEFLKLLSRHEDVDLAVAALEIARDAQPALEFADTLKWIDDRARELITPVTAARDERDLLQAISSCLADEHGLTGNDDFYDRAESSYLNRVIELRRGLPITLSVLYMVVAERVGVQLRGVCAPMHFLLRYESMDGPLFVDPYYGGRILEGDECLHWLALRTGLDVATTSRGLGPANSRSILIRMLNNLKSLHIRQEDWLAAWNVQHRLTALNPSSYPERRDLARIALRAGKPGFAVELLQCCLTTCPDEDRDLLNADLDQAQRLLARCN